MSTAVRVTIEEVVCFDCVRELRGVRKKLLVTAETCGHHLHFIERHPRYCEECAQEHGVCMRCGYGIGVLPEPGSPEDERRRRAAMAAITEQILLRGIGYMFVALAVILLHRGC